MSWTRTVVAFWVGAVVAGAAVFGVIGLVGWVVPVSVPSWLPLGVIALALVLDLVGPRPWGPHRQVDEDWLGRYRDWVTGLGFGAQLGVGFATIIPTWMTWALLVVSFAVGLPAALAVGVGFGAGRSLLLLTTRRIKSPSTLARMMQRFSSFEGMAGGLAAASYLLIIGLVVINDL